MRIPVALLNHRNPAFRPLTSMPMHRQVRSGNQTLPVCLGRGMAAWFPRVHQGSRRAGDLLRCDRQQLQGAPKMADTTSAILAMARSPTTSATRRKAGGFSFEPGQATEVRSTRTLAQDRPSPSPPARADARVYDQGYFDHDGVTNQLWSLVPDHLPLRDVWGTITYKDRASPAAPASRPSSPSCAASMPIAPSKATVSSSPTAPNGTSSCVTSSRPWRVSISSGP